MNEYCDFERDLDDNEIPEQGPRFTSLPTTPAGRPFMGFPPQAKRHRPMCDPNNYSPYATHSQTSWYKHTDSQINSLVDSQDKIMRKSLNALRTWRR